MDKQREMFEAWWKWNRPDYTKDYHLHEYRAWSAWQAAIAAQQAKPRCACGDSFTSDAVCANCLAAEWEPAK